MDKMKGIDLIYKIESDFKGKIILLTGYHDVGEKFSKNHNIIYKPININNIKNIFD